MPFRKSTRWEYPEKVKEKDEEPVVGFVERG